MGKSVRTIPVRGHRDRAEAVAREIEAQIRAGRFAPPRRLPSERALARRHNTGLRTVQNALRMLEDRGLIYRIERSGTFVRGEGMRLDEPARHTKLRCVNFIEHIWPYPSTLELVSLDHRIGYSSVLDNHEVHMRFVVCPEEKEHYEELLSPRFAPDEQGCVLVRRTDPSVLRWLRDRGIPHVVQHYWPYLTDGLPPHHRVYINRHGAAFHAVRHLFDLGHRRIGFVGATGPPASGQIMYPGYHAAFVSLGLPVRREDLLDVHVTIPEKAEQPCEAYLRRPDRPSAIVCQNDATAIGCLRAARRLGIAVPEELSVTGFDDFPEAANADPPLTTFENPRRLEATTAVELLLAVAAGQFDDYQTRILECRLVPRKSVGPWHGP